MIKRLIGIRLKSVFIGMISGKGKNVRLKSISTAKMVGFALLFLFIAAILMVSLFSTAASIALIMIPVGASELYLGLFMLLSVTVLFVLSIFETKSELFECKDNELLLSLPILPRDIVISRIFTVIAINYIVELVIAIPFALAYVLFGGSAIGIAGIVLSFLTIPLLATALAAGVGFIIAAISARLKNKNIVTIVFSVLFLAIYFYVYFYLLGSLDSTEGAGSDLSEIFARLTFVGVFGSVALLSPIATVVYLAVVAVASAVAYIAITANYEKIVTSTTGAPKRAYKAKKLTNRGAFYAIVSKEFSKIFSSAAYLLNGGVGLIFTVLIAVGVSINYNVIASSFVSVEDGITAAVVSELFAPVFIAILGFSSMMNTFSAASFSLEGRSFWILKSIPVKASTVLYAKCIPQIVISASANAIAGLVLAIVSSAPAVYYVFYILTPIAMSIFSAFLGILLNVAFPKLDHVSEIQVIKQSLPIFLVIMISAVLGIGVTVLSFVGSFMGLGILVCILMLAFYLILSLGAFLMIGGPAARKVEKLS